MKLKSLRVVLVGLFCLPFMSFGQDDITALRKKAEQGDADAQFNLGLRYVSGEGVPKNHKEAVKWYRLSAEQGFAKAQCNLGVCYAKGKDVPQDNKEAVRWYRLSAEQGDVNAQYNLGVRYYEGKGVPRDYVQAYAWLSMAMAQGEEKAKSDRADIIKKMSTAQIEEGQRLSREYAEKHVKK